MGAISQPCMETSFTRQVGMPAQLLALDGGGVKGVSSLLILNEIMKEVQNYEIETGINTSTKPRLPADYFDLAAGTSTGGLIALMLFRLRMTVPEAMDIYHQLAADVFSPTFFGFPMHKFGTPGYYMGKSWLKVKAVFSKAQFSDKPLRNAIDAAVKAHPLDDNDAKELGETLLRDERAGKMIMCATLADEGESVLFRSYPVRQDAEPISSGAKERSREGALENVSISVAARATSAALTYLPEVIWEGLKFWDGGLLNNNPIHQLWASRYDFSAEKSPAPPIYCILFLGTSYSDEIPSSAFRFFNTVSQAGSFITNTEAKHRDFQSELNRINSHGGDGTEYFRFNAPTGIEHFNLDGYKRMPVLEWITVRYLGDVREEIVRCARLLRKI